MAQIGKFLDPPKPDKGNSSKREPDPAQANSVMLPVTGFLRRLGALIFDLIFLYFFARIIVWAFGDILQPHAAFADKAASIFFLLYFGLGASPAGKGRTLGKIMLGIKVTDLDGNVPKFHQAFLRTALLFPGTLVALILPIILTDQSSLEQQKLRDFLPMICFFPLIIAYSFAIAFNPFKQGGHDYLSKTMVRPAGAPQLDFKEITALIGEGWQKLHKNPQLMALGTYVIIFGILMFQFINSETTDEQKREFEERQAILQEFEYDETFWNRGVLPVDDDYNTQEARLNFIASVHDEASTTPIVIVAGLYKEGLWNKEGEALEAEAKNFADTYHDRIVTEVEPSVVVPMQSGEIANFKKRKIFIEVSYVEILNLFFFVGNNEVGKYRFPYEPMDPRPLVIEEKVDEVMEQTEEANEADEESNAEE